MNGASEGDGGGYKRRCRALKRRLKLLLYVRGGGARGGRDLKMAGPGRGGA